jgi:hypothetical protein
MKYLLLFIVVLLSSSNISAQFGEYFEEKTLRLDYYHCGNATSDKYYFDELIQEPYWAGSKANLIDRTGYGYQKVEVHDAETRELIYSMGFSTLFGEWQATPEAKIIECCYPESVVMPFPRKAAIVSILCRNMMGEYEKKFEFVVNPKSYMIRREKKDLPVFDVLYSGNPNKKVDIVLLAEGYTCDQFALFTQDCQKFSDSFFEYAPYKENKKSFNIRGVWSHSEDEGPDVPGKDVWKNTTLNSSFYTFDSERYLMVQDFQKIRDMAGNAPYDYIYILANTAKYGGGAVYNFYGISAAHHINETGKIYIHEFGHLFAGLGDEYVGGVEYSEFYPVNVEPWEPNLTTLVDFDRKWKNMLPEGTPVPTPDKGLNHEKLGVYQGGGYVAKGVYRPWINCLMNNLHTIDVFCPVCSKAIQEMIDINCR